MGNKESPGLRRWLRTRWAYVLAVAIALNGGALYLGIRGFTLSGAGLAETSSIPEASAQEAAVDPYAGVKQEVLTYYRSRYGDDDPALTVEVVSYGCHLGAHVVKSGKVIKSFAYYGRGLLYELR